MRLRKQKDNELSFCKKIGKDIHGFNFEKFIRYMIKEVEDEEAADQDDDEDGEDEVEDSMDDS